MERGRERERGREVEEAGWRSVDGHGRQSVRWM